MSIVRTDDLALSGAGTLQQQLYDALAERLLSGRYRAGSRLPSSRQLARELAISRNTVIAVYEQLKSEGFLETWPGKGMFVHHDLQRVMHRPQAETMPPGMHTRSGESRTKPAWPPTPGNSVIGHYRSAGQDATLPFTPGLPDLQAFPLSIWNRTWHHHERRRHLLGYDTAQGYLPLRRAIRDYLQSARGVRCHEDQIIMTQGAQQGLSLIADCLLQPEDRILTENPGYRGARYALAKNGHPLHPIPLRHQVLDVETLTGPSADSNAAMLYCTPTHQYPMGGILSMSQRLRLLNWAMDTRTWIIEDDYDSEFHFYSKPIAALQGMHAQAPVIYLGSFSKTLMPSLRLGYLVVPEHLVGHFVWTKRITGGESPLLAQAVVADFMESGQFYRHVRKMRLLYRQKWELFQSLIQQSLSGRLEPVAESAGMHLVLTGAIRDIEACRYLAQQGFGSAPLSDHYLPESVSLASQKDSAVASQIESDAPQSGLIMGFASAADSDMRRCVRTLAEWLDTGGGG